MSTSQGNIKLLNIDCMAYMATLSDKAFDLAIIDPPYGIGEGSNKILSRHHSQKKYHLSEWDNASPDATYFNELMRVSKNQIIWGANHFISKMPINSSCWIFWDKGTEQCDFADGELAWTSFKTAVKKFSFIWNGFRQGYDNLKEHRVHPTQKPIALYKWLLKNYAKEGDRILDTHLGSGSSAIAAFDFKAKEFVGCEIDKDYYNAAVNRFRIHTSQYQLF